MSIFHIQKPRLGRQRIFLDRIYDCLILMSAPVEKLGAWLIDLYIAMAKFLAPAIEFMRYYGVAGLVLLKMPAGAVLTFTLFGTTRFASRHLGVILLTGAILGGLIHVLFLWQDGKLSLPDDFHRTGQ